jgi:hypothetical protein
MYIAICAKKRAGIAKFFWLARGAAEWGRAAVGEEGRRVARLARGDAGRPAVGELGWG